MGLLGCADDYLVQFSTKEGKLIGEISNAASLNWNRKLDDFSTASVNVNLGAQIDSAACCDLLNRIDVRRDVMTLYRNIGAESSQVWTGPIQKIISRREGAEIVAVDKLALYQNRILRLNHTHAGADLATIWNDYLQDANSVDPIITDLCPATGIILDRLLNASDRRIAWSELKELLDTGLDITLHRGMIIYGAKEIKLQRQALRDSHFIGEIQVVQDAAKVASQIYLKGYGDESVEYPSPAATPSVGYYGLVERVFVEENLSGASSLNTAAQSYYEQLANQKPYFLDMPGDSRLSPTAPVDINDLVCGTIFNVAIDDICPPMEQPLRMHEVNVSMGTDESVSISLQPIGSVIPD